MGRILLAFCDPEMCAFREALPGSPPQSESNVLSHLRAIVGMALSVDETHATIIACHAISVAGPWCRNEEERRRMSVFLTETDSSRGWPTSTILERLVRAWDF